MPGIRGDNTPALARAKRADNREWIRGYHVRFGGDGKDYIVPENASTLYAYEVIPHTVSRETGKTDRYGKRVFNHDIVRKGRNVHAIIWLGEDAEYAGYLLPGFLLETGMEMTGAEVIGNIFDNPELLPEERKVRYKCIKEMWIRICDRNGSVISDRYGCVIPGSIWEADDSAGFICNNIHLDSLYGSRFGWIEISYGDLKNHFARITDPQMDDQ